MDSGWGRRLKSVPVVVPLVGRLCGLNLGTGYRRSLTRHYSSSKYISVGSPYVSLGSNS